MNGDTATVPIKEAITFNKLLSGSVCGLTLINMVNARNNTNKHIAGFMIIFL